MNKGLNIFRYLLMIVLASICAYFSFSMAENWFVFIFTSIFFFLFIGTILIDAFKKRCLPTSLTIILIVLMLVILGIIFRPWLDYWLFVKPDIYFNGQACFDYTKMLFHENFVWIMLFLMLLLASNYIHYKIKE